MSRLAVARECAPKGPKLIDTEFSTVFLIHKNTMHGIISPSAIEVCSLAVLQPLSFHG